MNLKVGFLSFSLNASLLSVGAKMSPNNRTDIKHHVRSRNGAEYKFSLALFAEGVILGIRIHSFALRRKLSCQQLENIAGGLVDKSDVGVVLIPRGCWRFAGELRAQPSEVNERPSFVYVPASSIAHVASVS